MNNVSEMVVLFEITTDDIMRAARSFAVSMTVSDVERELRGLIYGFGTALMFKFFIVFSFSLMSYHKDQTSYISRVPFTCAVYSLTFAFASSVYLQASRHRLLQLTT